VETKRSRLPGLSVVAMPVDTTEEAPGSRSGWLVTGGAGYIGSHVLHALRAAGERVVALDDLSTGRRSRVPAGVPLVVASVSDQRLVRETLRKYRLGGVVHLAAKKSVEESCADPLLYYRENLGGLLSMLQAMRAEGVRRMVFSSSAAVYGNPAGGPVDESARTQPESPYGRSKLVGEWMVRDVAAAHDISVVCLRYFNVVGCASPDLADVGGANLFPRIMERVAAQEPILVFGTDYPTRDGTCVRDYVHVQDLAEAHVHAARLTASRTCDELVNVGCGEGYSVLDVVEEFARNAGVSIGHAVRPRRPGDPAAVVADVGHATALLGWRARFGLGEMVSSTWAAGYAPARGRTAEAGRAAIGGATASGMPAAEDVFRLTVTG
jgi:UDP-glucose 4-epimerase